MLTKEELDNILVQQKERLINGIDTLPELSPIIRTQAAQSLLLMIKLLLPLWDACNYHYKAQELIDRLNHIYNSNFKILPTTKENGL
jgi:hypothetical protein